jgi:hypothetical protein
MARDQLIKALVDKAAYRSCNWSGHPCNWPTVVRVFVRDPMWLGRVDSGAIGPNSTTPGQAFTPPNYEE